MKRLLASLLLAVACSLSSASAGNVGRIPTVTRLVHVFFGLETQLADAVLNRDNKTASHLLSEDFEMRVGAMPGSPIPRADWIKESFNEPKSESSFEQMAVHDYGKVAVASFLWQVQEVKSKDVRNIYVVDVWSKKGNEWQLSVRYAEPTGRGRSVVPGAKFVVPSFEKKE